jgi:hypothetical protein
VYDLINDLMNALWKHSENGGNMRTFHSNVLDILGWFAIAISFLSGLFQVSAIMSSYPSILFELVFTSIGFFVIALIMWSLARILRNQALIIEQTKKKQD